MSNDDLLDLALLDLIHQAKEFLSFEIHATADIET